MTVGYDLIIRANSDNVRLRLPLKVNALCLDQKKTNANDGKQLASLADVTPDSNWHLRHNNKIRLI